MSERLDIAALVCVMLACLLAGLERVDGVVLVTFVAFGLHVAARAAAGEGR